jgi:hypothetical protein
MFSLKLSAAIMSLTPVTRGGDRGRFAGGAARMGHMGNKMVDK